jgi:class 3 adenylate cyclase
MNYDGLQDSYWRDQAQRVAQLRDKINARAMAVPGRVVPGDEDLAIGEGRRLNVAVLFLDISGFSNRPSETVQEQDQLLRILNLFFSEMIKIAEDYGGTVEKNTGDGLLAYYENGGGTSPEGAVKRAVASALTMFAANYYLIRPILLSTPAPEIVFRVSIDYGPITVARLGAARRFNANVAIGATANFASKMLALAAPGEIVLGETAKDQLPLFWQVRFAELATLDTGWTFRSDNRPYRLYRYTGRWSKLV